MKRFKDIVKWINDTWQTLLVLSVIMGAFNILKNDLDQAQKNKVTLSEMTAFKKQTEERLLDIEYRRLSEVNSQLSKIIDHQQTIIDAQKDINQRLNLVIQKNMR